MRSGPNHFIIGSLIALATFALHPPAHSQCVPDEIAAVEARDPAADDRFGWSVDIDGEYAIVGAPGPLYFNKVSGAAYIHKWDESSGQWVEQQQLMAADPDIGDQFGCSVAISGDFAMVGAYLDNDNGENSGSAYIFRRFGDTWEQTQKLIAPDGEPEDQFGISVAMRGDVAIVGAPRSFEPVGHVYLYRWNGLDWMPDGEFGTAEYSGFGYSVDIGGDVALIGAPKVRIDGQYYCGQVFFLRWTGSFWIIEQSVTGEGGSNTGLSVSISGDRALVGVPGGVEGYPLPGSAIMFDWNRDTLVWEERQTLEASDGYPNDGFGASTDLINGQALIGAPTKHNRWGRYDGFAYFFQWDSQAGEWVEAAQLEPEEPRPEGQFGLAVAFSDDTALVGMPTSEYDSLPGSAHFFDLHCTGPVLTTVGSCPGPMRFEVARASSGGRVAYLSARGEGSFGIPPGNPCAGTILGLNATVQLADAVRADSEGVATLDVPHVPNAACGRIYIQAVDLESCATTNVLLVE